MAQVINHPSAKMETRYIPVTETAKLIRQALKEAFPEIKFSVRTSKYAGGSSIDVSWTNGPHHDLVDVIVKRFQGGYFDGQGSGANDLAQLQDAAIRGPLIAARRIRFHHSQLLSK